MLNIPCRLRSAFGLATILAKLFFLWKGVRGKPFTIKKLKNKNPIKENKK